MRYQDHKRAVHIGIEVVVGVCVTAAVVWTSDSDEVARAEMARVETAMSKVVSYDVKSAEHVKGRVAYAQSPPVGGDHFAQWVDCGFYDQVLSNEQAVHSMEHGAVWITYDGTLHNIEVEALKRLAEENDDVLVSPYDGLDTAVVASAWGKQRAIPFGGSPAMSEFVAEYANGPQTPEPGAPCTGGARPSDGAAPEGPPNDADAPDVHGHDHERDDEH